MSPPVGGAVTPRSGPAGVKRSRGRWYWAAENLSSDLFLKPSGSVFFELFQGDKDKKASPRPMGKRPCFRRRRGGGRLRFL